jgi:hypothetical protein
VIRHQTDIIKQQQQELASMRTAVATLRRQQHQHQQHQHQHQRRRLSAELQQSIHTGVPYAVHGTHHAIAAAMAFTPRGARAGVASPSLSTTQGQRWQVPSRDLRARMNMVAIIMARLRSIHASSAQSVDEGPWQLDQRLSQLAKKLEAYLYRNAETAETYGNEQTIQRRIAGAMRHWGGVSA